jgi:cell fate regulator YaaT (PSP1 superfamily)
MAKDQNLVLNPQKVSGVCGRLMCCLTYEQKAYEVSRKGLPKVGKRVLLKEGGHARVRDLDVLARRLRVQTEDGTTLVIDPEDIAPPQTDGDRGGQRDKRGGKGQGEGRRSRPPESSGG